MNKNYKLTIAYDGSRFFGWERQPGRDTIQGKIETVLAKLTGAPADVIGAGRTDAGVHARAMVASVRLDTDLSPEEIRDYLNRYLPDAIAVREVKEAGERFHARYNALGKTYRYTCFDGPVKPVFDRKYVTMLDFRPDLERMQRAAALTLRDCTCPVYRTGAAVYCEQKERKDGCLHEPDWICQGVCFLPHREPRGGAAGGGARAVRRAGLLPLAQPRAVLLQRPF